MPTPPLAERIRPDSLDTFIGQKHLVGKDAILRNALEAGVIPSMIFWGPPGSGKTTLANIISNKLSIPFIKISAVSSGVKDVKAIIEKARFNSKTALFIDEIHRFNKTQQDALLGAVEKGIITLIGATTENPSFEVISPLLSRCQVYILKPLEEEELVSLLKYVIKNDVVLKKKGIQLKEHQALLRISGGDARKLLNLLELAVDSAAPSTRDAGTVTISDDIVINIAQQKIALYDKKGEQHYDIISAFIKSMRGSDPNAAVYWLARMLEGGEEPKFIARRMIILASEDIGNANPMALVLAVNCFHGINFIGLPEAELILSQTAAYLASSPKSNASYKAIKKAKGIVKESGDLPVPLHLRNAPTKLMKNIGYGMDYKYAHDFENNFVEQQYLPDEIKGTLIYNPGKNSRENELRARLKKLWEKKYEY
ncbi:MAG: replication-associated recombination protein A [Cytophagales bacterium]|nr:replication-associated recombination protein A [Cytophagales bacterium]